MSVSAAHGNLRKGVRIKYDCPTWDKQFVSKLTYASTKPLPKSGTNFQVLPQRYLRVEMLLALATADRIQYTETLSLTIQRILINPLTESQCQQPNNPNGSFRSSRRRLEFQGEANCVPSVDWDKGQRQYGHGDGDTLQIKRVRV